MFKNASELPTGESVEAEVCIVGAGPAGLTVASELEGFGCKVVMLESGGFQRRRKLRQLNEGETAGDGYHDPRWGRERRLGGSANRWLIELANGKMGARFAPLDRIDFEKRDWMPGSGWPINRADLDPFYRRAGAYCGVDLDKYDRLAWPETAGDAIETGLLETGIYQFGRQERWTKGLTELVGKSSSIDAILGASVVEIEMNETGELVIGVKAVDDAGRSIAVRAKQFVLAVGCIETSRLLLNSRSVHTNGLGNGNDVVGRYFMDHPQSYLNVFRPSNPNVFNTFGAYDIHLKGETAVMAKLVLSQETLAREHVPNSCHLLFPRRDHFLSPAFQSFFSLALDFKRRARPKNVGQHFINIAKGIRDLIPIAGWFVQGTAHYPHLSKGGWSNLSQKNDLFESFEIWSLYEQTPDPANRITLIDRRDYIGTPLVKIDWRFTERDRQGVRRVRELIAQDIESTGLGKVAWSPDLYSIPSSVHPTGGARMGTDRRTSVVSPDLNVHGVPNLFIAGSATLPTGGYVNPTLTVLALACRIADRVKRDLSSAVVIEQCTDDRTFEPTGLPITPPTTPPSQVPALSGTRRDILP
jgi:choline dehydrogenase-like flavoprotein